MMNKLIWNKLGKLSVWKFIIFMLSCMAEVIVKAFDMEYSGNEMSLSLLSVLVQGFLINAINI